MLSTVVVGIDGKDGGADAIALAKTLAAPDAEIVLVHAYPYEDERPSKGALAQYEELLRREADERLRAAGDDPCFVYRAIPSTKPARALQREAADRDADAIVVGSCHRSAIGRILLGDVSRAVLHGAPCPVAVAPGGEREARRHLKTVGAGVDDSAPARAAAALAATIARDHGAQLRLLAVVQPPIPFSPEFAYSFDWAEEAAEQRKAAATLLETLAAGLDTPAQTEVQEGSPVQSLERLSGEVDLLVLGARDQGAVRRLILGSTGDRVLHEAHCPLVLTPAT